MYTMLLFLALHSPLARRVGVEVCMLTSDVLPVSTGSVTMEAMRGYIYLLICRTAGGQDEYDEFLDTQVRIGCAQSRKLQLDSRVVSDALRGVHAMLSHLQQKRQTRIVSLCDILNNTPVMPDCRVLFWNLCSMSGLPTQRSLRIESPTTVLHVEERFSAFVQSYWLLMHISQLEVSRMQTFVAHLPSETSLAAQIQQYTNSTHTVSDSELGVYIQSLCFVVDTLQATIDGIPGAEVTVRTD